MDECFSSRACERGPDFCNIANMVERGFYILPDEAQGRGWDKGLHQGCEPGRTGRQWCHQAIVEMGEN